jgi:hypothetical protein
MFIVMTLNIVIADPNIEPPPGPPIPNGIPAGTGLRKGEEEPKEGGGGGMELPELPELPIPPEPKPELWLLICPKRWRSSISSVICLTASLLSAENFIVTSLLSDILTYELRYI